MNESEAVTFTNKLYGAIVHRPGDAAGIKFWSTRFIGMSKVDALINFIEAGSAEVNSLASRVTTLEREVRMLNDRPSHSVTNVEAITQTVLDNILRRLTD